MVTNEYSAVPVLEEEPPAQSRMGNVCNAVMFTPAIGLEDWSDISARFKTYEMFIVALNFDSHCNSQNKAIDQAILRES